MAGVASTYPAASQTLTAKILPTTVTTVPRSPRVLRMGFTYAKSSSDFPITSPTKSISGTIYLASGATVAGATVKLVRQADDEVVQTTTTDASGNYLFLRDANDTLAYYVISYTSGTAPQIHGVSDRGRVPA